jgi:hypothetical protein
MRRAILLLFVSTPLMSGCAALIAQSGQHLSQIASRNELQATLGTPVAMGVVDGQPYEEFRTRKVIADELFSDGDGYFIAFAVTFGTIDLIEVPHQLFLLTKRSVLGQTIRVTYDKKDKISHITRDDQDIGYWFGKLTAPSEQKTGDVQPVSATTVSGPSAPR